MTKHSHTFITGLIGGLVGGFVMMLIFSRQPNFINRFSNHSLEEPIQTSSEPFTPANTQESQVVQTVQQTQPAVVSIIISQDVPILERYYETIPNNRFGPFDNFFSPFQFQVPQLRQNGTQKQEIGGGSGFLVSADGMIVTNKHVVDQENAEYTVFTNDGKKYDAKVLARDPSNDIAILKIDGNNFQYLKFANSDEAQVGQSVIAIGNTLGEFRNTVSLGVISGLSRSIVAGTQFGQAEQLDEVIQTDAAINPGNSGGPLLTLKGEVIGVNVAVAQGSQSVGFALPANTVATAVDSIQKTGTITRPYIGVRYTTITPAIKEKNKLSVDYGVLVTRGETINDLAVIPGSPADKAGIQENDIILEADGVKLDEKTSLASLIKKKKVGDSMQLKIIHKGQEKTVSVTLEQAK